MRENEKEYQELKAEFSLFDGDGDSYAPGKWLYHVALELYMRGEKAPEPWGLFEPWACETDKPSQDHEAATVRRYSTPVLIRFGNFLERYTRLLKIAEKAFLTEGGLK